MNSSELSLNNIAIGETAIVKGLNSTYSIKRRLHDLGIIEGTKISCVLKSPSGDPTAYYVKGAIIALRSDISSQIILYRQEEI